MEIPGPEMFQEEIRRMQETIEENNRKYRWDRFRQRLFNTIAILGAVAVFLIGVYVTLHFVIKYW